MPFAPPVTIAVLPASLAIALFLCAHAADELFEAGELKLDHVDRRLILELDGLLVELLRRKRDDHLRPAEQKRIDRSQRLAQVTLHPRAAENTAGGRLQRHRLVLERLILHARDPVDGILQPARDRPVILRRDDDQPVGPADGIRPGSDLGREAGRLLDVEIVERKALERGRVAQLHSAGCQCRQGARERSVVGTLAQRAADHEHVELPAAHHGFPPKVPYQLLAATRAMKAANAANCCLIKPRVASSLSSPVFSSNLDAQLPMKISGLFSVKASRNIMHLRRSYCTRAPPTGPGETDCSATGLPAKGWFCSRDTQSIAFLSAPGILKLYSGVQKITPSAARIASASVLTGAGKPVEFWMSAL